VSSFAVTDHGSGLWQMAQLGFPGAASGTRFLRPQLGQTMIWAP
jgi:hypothetical protein